jgi:transaldolase/transaldolase/glucose-6-phosphate isomerase
MTKLHELAELGQAIWLDYIHRSLITSGELRKFVNQGLRGVTSNPSIFEKAIAGSTDYDEEMNHLVGKGKSVEQIYEGLAIDDIRGAADVLRSVYDEGKGTDGYVSLEVNPNLAHNTEGTIAEARRLFTMVGRPNVMIKVPATPEGIPAIEQLIGEGVNVNVTLIFSLDHYEAVAAAYIAGLEKLAAAGGDLRRVASVASFFISRVDTAVDASLESVGNSDLQGKIGIGNAKIAYVRFSEIFSGERWQKIAAQGARVQRPLWASTGTKNPAYPDTLYVDNLIGADTVNTLPPDTFQYFMSHGNVSATVGKDLAGARSRLAGLAKLGIDLDGITARLQDEGVAAFAKSFDGLIASIAEKREKFLANWEHISAGAVS